jgi:hypothetical protein
MTRFFKPAGFARLLVLTLASATLSGCAAELVGTGFVNDKSATARVATTEAVVDEEGRCTADLSIDPALFRNRPDSGLVGMTECELVATKGTPLSVQTGASSSARRETTMLYMEPTGKALYLFANNRLVRVIRGSGGQ